MAILLKTASVRVSSIQIIQVRVQNKGKSVWKSRYDGDVSGIILHHWSIAYELSIYCSSLIYFPVAIATITTKYQKHYFYYCYLLLPLSLLSFYFATKHFVAEIKFLGVVELTTQLLILESILWLPLCRINKFGLNTLPSKTIAISYTCGSQDYFLALLPESIALFFESLGIYICLSLWRTWKIQEPRFIPQLRGEVRNCHLALHLIHLLFWVSVRHLTCFCYSFWYVACYWWCHFYYAWFLWWNYFYSW